MNKRFFKPLSNLITISAVALLLTACGGGGGGGGGSTSTSNAAPVTFTGGTNGGIVNGVALGYGTKLNENIVKLTPVSPLIGNFSVDLAYLSRITSSGFYWIIPITNNGPPRCGIQLLSIDFRDSSNALLFSENGYVTGSKDPGMASLNWCLATGEKGYVLGIKPVLNADAVNRVVISSINEGTAPTGMPAENWKPLHYGIVTANSFIVTVQNTGSVSAGTSNSKYILFGTFFGGVTSYPLTWGYFDNSVSSISPSGTAILTENSYIYEGLATSMEVFIE